MEVYNIAIKEGVNWNMFAAAPFTHWGSGKLFK